MTDPVAFAGSSPDAVRITHPSRAALLADIADRFRLDQGFTLATLNLDHVVKLRRDPAFRKAYLAQSHVVADGNPIVWLSWLAGREIDLIPGSELIAPLCALAAEMAVPVGLLGATQDTLDEAAAALERDYPGLRIVARIAPPFGFDVQSSAADGILQDLEESGARLCFLALGAPKQERLAVRGAAALPQVGFVSIGAGLDFIAGSQNRAPLWMRRLALEWLWRLVGNPGRLMGRYALCIAVLPKLTWQAWRSGRA